MIAVLFGVFVAACALVLAWIDSRRIELRDAEIARLDAAREADADEAAATYNALAAELESLRCGDLHLFFDGRLPPVRAAAFRAHLATCTECDAGLLDLAQLEARMVDERGAEAGQEIGHVTHQRSRGGAVRLRDDGADEPSFQRRTP